MIFVSILVLVTLKYLWSGRSVRS